MSERLYGNGFLPPVKEAAPKMELYQDALLAYEKRAKDHERKLVFGRRAELHRGEFPTEHGTELFIGAIAIGAQVCMPDPDVEGRYERLVNRPEGGTMRLVTNENPKSQSDNLNDAEAAAIYFRARHVWRWRLSLLRGPDGTRMLPGRYAEVESVYISPSHRSPQLRRWIRGQSWFNRHIDAQADRPASRYELKDATDIAKALTGQTAKLEV